jgi:hypothetical protein
MGSWLYSPSRQIVNTLGNLRHMTDIRDSVLEDCVRIAGEIKQKCAHAAFECDALIHSLEYVRTFPPQPGVTNSATQRDFSDCKTYPDAARAYLDATGQREAKAGEIFEGLVRAGYWKTVKDATAHHKFNQGIVARNSAGIETIKDGASTADEWVVRIRPTK